MLPESKLKSLHDLTQTFSIEELIWVNGYLSGLVAHGHRNIEDKELSNGNGHAVTDVKKITLLFGTETGNSKKLATDFTVLAKKKGIVVKLTSLDQYRFSDLEKEEYLFIIISTHGEGEPPAAAKKFYDHVHSEALKLGQLKFSILALGDTAYPLFCTAGEHIDSQLEKAGGKRIVPLQKCDVEYESDASSWFEQVFAALDMRLTAGSHLTQAGRQTAPSRQTHQSLSTGKKYFTGTVITNINLNDRGSNKETYHIEISTNETVDYEPGDSLAIIPLNKQAIVEDIIRITGITREQFIETSKISATAEELLTKHLNICYLLTSTIKKYAAVTELQVPEIRVDLIDLLRQYPVKSPAQFEEVIKVLTPIAPRLYSISSAPAVHDKEIHITVSKDSFFTDNQQRYGLCSEFIGGMPVSTKVKFYIHRNRAFKLPAADKDIILVGPGTGIAPSRSFLIERDATSAPGKNWLFFGEQHFTTDFLYQTELQNYLQTGVLDKLSLAFSRDQRQKIYVTHKILEERERLAEWINSGAYVYISGSKAMGADVDETFANIIGEALLNELKKEGRYQKDVY